MITTYNLLPTKILHFDDKRDYSILIKSLVAGGYLKKEKRQRYSFKEEHKEQLKKTFLFWRYLSDIFCKNFAEKVTLASIAKKIISGVFNNRDILFFGLFCPSYKKGVQAYGFVENVGMTTKRGLTNLSKIYTFAMSLGIMCRAEAYYCDLILENYEMIIAEDCLRDLEKNYGQFYKTGLSINSSLILKKLSQVKPFSDVLPRGAISCEEITIPTVIINRIIKRSYLFYRNVFGWSFQQCVQRTKELAVAYAMIGEIIRNSFENSIIIFTENMYERGALFNGNQMQEPIAIIFPNKKETKDIINGSQVNDNLAISLT